MQKSNQIDVKNNTPLPNDDYDPHEHRNVEKPTTNSQAFANFIKGALGTGILAFPNAFSHAGYINGLILTTVIGIIAVYCLHILFNSMYELCKRKRMAYITYSNSIKMALQEGPPLFKCLVPIATQFVDGFLALYHFGICCVYVVFISESIKQVVDEYFPVWDLRIHMCFLLVPLLMIFSVRNLKMLAPFSVFANILMLFGFGCVLYYIFNGLPPLSERKQFEHIFKMPIFFGIVLFALEAVGVIIAIEENMKTPKDYVKPFGVMNVAMTLVLVLYAAIGFFGYWKYGEEVLGSVTLNIPKSDYLAQTVKIIFAVTVWISYGLQGYVTIDIIWNKYLSKRVENTSKHLLYELLLRTAFVLASLLCAIGIPELSLFLSLVGAFCLSILGIIFPAVMEICVRYNTGYGPWKLNLIKSILIVIFGICGGIIGTGTSIVDIIDIYKKNKNFLYERPA